MYIDRIVIICVGVATEVDALKKALAEVEGKVVEQQAAWKKLEARVKEVQQELQDAVKKCEALEHDASVQGAELAKARQSTKTERNEAQAALQEIQEAKKITTGKAFKMQSKYAEKQYLLLTRVRSSRELLRIYHAVYQMPRSSIEPKEGVLRRSYSGCSMRRQSITCPSPIS